MGNSDILQQLSQLPLPDELAVNRIQIAILQDKYIFNNKLISFGYMSTIALNFCNTEKALKLQKIVKEYAEHFLIAYIPPDKILTLEHIKKLDSYLKQINNYLSELEIFDKILNKQKSLESLYNDLESFFCDLEKNSTPEKDKNDFIKDWLSTLLLSYVYLGDDLLQFYFFMGPFCKDFITRLKKNDQLNYADAYEYYFNNLDIMNLFTTELLIKNEPKSRFVNAEHEFKPVIIPGTKDKQLAEVITFKSLFEFLHFDFFKALLFGNTIRCCQNCGKFFLQTTKYYTRYCENIAPGYTDKTCRQVGALKKEKEKVENSPIHQLYNKCYKKINQRYNRKRISSDEYNNQISYIADLKDQALVNKISIEELQKKYKNL